MFMVEKKYVIDYLHKEREMVARSGTNLEEEVLWLSSTIIIRNVKGQQRK